MRQVVKELKERLNPATQCFKIVNDSMKKLAEDFNPTVKIMEGITKSLTKSLKPTFELIEKIQESNKKGKKIRGEIITDIIDLDELLEFIIATKYVMPDLEDEFITKALNDRGFSSKLKFDIVRKSGLLDGLEITNKIEALYTIRNVMAHKRYHPTVEAVMVFHKEKMTSLQSLKDRFDEIYKEVKEKLEALLEDLEKKYKK